MWTDGLRTRVVSLTTMALGVGSAAPVLAQTITDGNSTFTQVAANTTGAAVRTGTGGGTAAIFAAGGDTTDQLFQQWWWYHVAGGAREFALSNRTSNVAAGNVLTLEYSEPEGFRATIRYTLTDGPDTPASANIAAEAEIFNTGTTPLTISLFSYLDYDVEGATGDSAVLAEPGRMVITDTTGFFGQFLGISPDHYAVAGFAAVRDQLTNTTLTDLGDTGLPFAAGDWTGAMQWNLVIPPSASRVVRTAFALNMEADAGGGTTCVGDTDGDNDVDLQDLSNLLSHFGTTSGAGVADGDTDADGDVDLQDLSNTLSNFGGTC